MLWIPITVVQTLRGHICILQDTHYSNMMGTPHCIPYEGLAGSGDNVLFTIDTHPSTNVLAAGEINGKVTLYRYCNDVSCDTILEYTHHEGYSCRSLQFSRHGNRLYSGSGKNGALYITDTETGTLSSLIKKAHSTALYSLHSISERLLASGDESGELKVWDCRSWKCIMSVHDNKDFISDMTCNHDCTTLLATSGDGTLSAFDLRQKKLEQRSDPSESELLSLAIVKGGRKVVCGDGEGCLMLFNWGLWGDTTDRFPSHPQSIDSLLNTSDSVVCSGCMDGAIRAVQILPNRVLAEVGRHTDSYPIDCMKLTHDNQFMVTCSQDCCKFWAIPDIPTLAPDRIGNDQFEEEVGGTFETRKRRKKRKRQGSETKPVDTFFSDLL